MPRSKTSSKPQVVLSRVRWIIAVAILAGVAFSAIAFRSNGTTTVSAQRADDQIAAPDATTVISGNLAPITINDNTTASLYPSDATVSGVNQSITRVRVQLNNFSHTFPDDVDIILEGPQGQRAMVMSDAGAGIDVSGITLTFDSTAALSAVLPDELPLTTGTYRAANYGNGGGVFTDTFPAPFPAPNVLSDGPADLSVFHQTNPNGTWRLYVVDDAGTDVGTISGGWTLLVTVPNIFTVNSTNDPGNGVCDASECTLREAITAAINATGNSDQISFDSSFNTPKTIDLLTPLPDITESMAIAGPGANLLTVRRSLTAATNFRIFTIVGGIANGVAISGMHLTGGRATGDFGGGIYSQSKLALNNLYVAGNSGADGGAVSLVFSDGVFAGCTFSNNIVTGNGGGINYYGDGGNTLRIVNSTISGNDAGSGGGGILNLSGGGNSRLEVTNSTITNNSSILNGGGIFTAASVAGANSTTTLRNSIVALNSGNNLGTQAEASSTATFQTLGFNLSDNYNGVFTPLGTDITSATPRLAPLALYGGQTPTHALLHASPAINAGDASGQATDQRGVARVFGATADIGAVEMRPLVVINTGAAGADTLRGAISTASTNGAELDDIVFLNTVFNTPRTITLDGTDLQINGQMNIIGPAADLLTISGNNASRVFFVPSGITATLSGMTITGGNGNSDNGGGIINFGTLTVSDSVVSGNNANNGGGIEATSTLNLIRSTINNNVANFQGGGVRFFDASGSITNSTISGNTANSTSSAGGGVYVESGINSTVEVTNSTIVNNITGSAATTGGIRTVSFAPASVTTFVRNSIIANNTLPNLASQANGGSAVVSSRGFNLANDNGGGFLNFTGDQINVNPLLGPLANNGGPTRTHALLGGSTALDRGNSSGSTSDQRGLTRPIDLAGITNTSDASDIGAFEARTVPVAQNRAPFDYDGDNKTDISIFRPGPGEWWALRSSNGSNFALQFGSSVDKIVPADYTGDGKTDIAFWRPSNGNWFVLRSEDLTFFAFPFGATSDVPVPSDFDGDGKADPAVFRPSTQNWFINKSTGGTDILTFGAAGDKPVVADYDGDSKADIAIFRPTGVSGSEWWIRSSSNASVFALQFGVSTDRPVQGDFTGDGKADVAFWRPANGNWFVLRSEDLSFFAFPFGANGDTPVPGDYDGDGKFDAGVFRPSSVTWFVQRSTAGTLIQAFGTAGDIPTPSAYVP